MAFLKPDRVISLGGVTVNEFLLTKHNPNRIAMPSILMPEVIGVTIHNTDWIRVSSLTTPAEQYTRATYNGNMNDVRIHYYVDHKCAWQNLPLNLSGWHAADGSGNGNRKTISIECIMSSAYNATDKKSEDNCAKLAAALLKQYGLTIDNLYTHSHWLNVRDGKSGTVDQLNVMKNVHKNCPAYILPHWQSFKNKVQSYMQTPSTKTEPVKEAATSSSNNTAKKTLYRVRLAWNKPNSQTGAFYDLEIAKKCCKAGYTVFDEKGNPVYKKPVSVADTSKGQKVVLKNVKLYTSSTTTKHTRTISGTYWVYDNNRINKRIRITNNINNVGKTPAAVYVTGWVNASDLSD